MVHEALGPPQAANFAAKPLHGIGAGVAICKAVKRQQHCQVCPRQCICVKVLQSMLTLHLFFTIA